jgi:hypothetical protein
VFGSRSLMYARVSPSRSNSTARGLSGSWSKSEAGRVHAKETKGGRWVEKESLSDSEDFRPAQRYP